MACDYQELINLEVESFFSGVELHYRDLFHGKRKLIIAKPNIGYKMKNDKRKKKFFGWIFLGGLFVVCDFSCFYAVNTRMSGLIYKGART